MQTHETPSFQPAASTVKNNLPAPRPFEDIHSGQELDSLSSNPFPPRPHEVWMGEPRGGSTNPFPRRRHEVDMGEPAIARKPVSPPVQAEANPDPEANPFIFGKQPFRMNPPDAPPPPRRRWGIQAKLTVGQPNDVYEQEADRVAEQVISMGSPATPTVQRQAEEEEPEDIQTKPLAETITPLVQRQAELEEDEPIQAKCEDCEAEEPIQRTADGTPQAQPDLESRLNASQGGGSALPDEVRSFMEPRFGADFSQVRVHTASESVQMNRELNAQAFTHKQNVYFGASKAPGKDALTAHELTHVVQQTGQGQCTPAELSIQRGGTDPESATDTSHVSIQTWDKDIPDIPEGWKINVVKAPKNATPTTQVADSKGKPVTDALGEKADEENQSERDKEKEIKNLCVKISENREQIHDRLMSLASSRLGYVYTANQDKPTGAADDYKAWLKSAKPKQVEKNSQGRVQLQWDLWQDIGHEGDLISCSILDKPYWKVV